MQRYSVTARALVTAAAARRRLKTDARRRRAGPRTQPEKYKTSFTMLSRVFLLLAMVASATAFFAGTPLQTVSRQEVRRSSRSNMEMRARVCDLLGKRPNRQARVVTFSHARNKKVQHVNLQSKRYYSDDLGRNVKLRLSTKGMKTITKYGGVDAAAKKFGLDLTKF